MCRRQGQGRRSSPDILAVVVMPTIIVHEIRGDSRPGPEARSDRHRDSGQSRPVPAPRPSTLLLLQAPVRHMRGSEIPGSWPDRVSILSRSGPVSRQVPEFGLVQPSTRAHACYHQTSRLSELQNAVYLQSA